MFPFLFTGQHDLYFVANGGMTPIAIDNIHRVRRLIAGPLGVHDRQNPIVIARNTVTNMSGFFLDVLSDDNSLTGCALFR